MGVLFNNIPGNIRVPLFYAEFQPGGTPYQSNARLLLIGQRRSTGLATANEPILVRDGQENDLFGDASMLAQMVRAARKNAPLQEIWALPVDDVSGGTAATGTITITNAPVSQQAVLTLYIAGQRVRVPLLTTDNNAGVATAVAAAINAEVDLPVTAVVNGSTTNQVDVTARHKGSLGNAIVIDTGDLTTDGKPPVTVTIVAMASGATDPDLATPLAALGDDEYDWIAAPYADTTNLGRVSDLLGDVSGRWSYLKQIYGHYFCVHTGTVSALSTLGNARNDQHVSIFPCRKFLSTPWQVAAALGAVAAVHLQDAPELSRPIHSLPLVGIVGPRAKSDHLTKTDRQTLYYDGISGYYISKEGAVRIDRVVTTYQTNAWGDPDWTYLDVETMAQSMYGIRYIRTAVTSVHGRQALANDNPGKLPHIATPIDIRNTALHAYSRLVSQEGVFENLPAFSESLVVERDSTDANRINVGMHLDHVNQLRIIAAAAVNHMQLAA